MVNRAKLRKFLESMQLGDGSFMVHEGGEVDIRGVYLALSVAKLTNVYSDDLFLGTAEWVARYYYMLFYCHIGFMKFSCFFFCYFHMMFPVVKHMKGVLVETQEWKLMEATHFVAWLLSAS